MRKNKIIIGILVVTIIVLVAFTVAWYVYTQTDLFKSNEELFYKYLGKTQFVDKQVEQEVAKILNNTNNGNYSSTGNINCSISTNDSTTNVANIQNLFLVKYNASRNRELNQSYADYQISSNNENLITFRYLQDGNTYALKADNVVNKYLALENSNLKSFFKKLGVEDTTNIPDSIPIVECKEIFNIDSDLLNSIKLNYMSVIKNNITSNNFVKESNENIKITLSLTEKEVFNIEKELLEKLKNDEEVLNLIIDKASILGYDLNIDSFRTAIQEQLDTITQKEYSEETYIQISVIENNKKTTGLEFKLSQQESQNIFKIDFSENHKMIIQFNNGEGDTIKEIITFGYENNKFETNVDIFEMVEENTEKNVAKIQYQAIDYETNNIKQNIVIEIKSDEDTKIQVNFDSDTQLKNDIEIEKITDENATKLNEMTSNQLSNLITAIFTRIQFLYGDKIAGIMELAE